MKTLCGFIGWIVGMFLGFMVMNTIPFLSFILIIGGIPLGRYIGGCIEEDKERERRAREEAERRRRQQQWEQERKEKERQEAIELARKYPEAIKNYFKIHWGITKSYITASDITYERAKTLLTYRYSFPADEQKYNVTYQAEVEAERRRQEQRRREAELEKQRKEQERRNIIATLPLCVSGWNSHSNSNLKHKYYYEYYSYARYKDFATNEMWVTWHLVWNFKNDPDKGISNYDHNDALKKVVEMVEDTLRKTFGTKTEYLTLVCLTASTQRKTDLRFKEFADRVCTDLRMENAYGHITVTGGGSAKHEGGSGVSEKAYDQYFFQGKNVVLFDDVRTSGSSIEQERRVLERMGAKIICAITIAQTR